MVVWLTVKKPLVEILSGTPAWYKSSEHGRRGFCAACGTTLFFASTACPGEIHVARPAFPGPIDREPQCHVFYDQRADWIEVGDSLPRYTREDPDLAKFKDVPA